MTDPRWSNGAPACWIGFGPNGVGHYRTMMPAEALRGSLFMRHESELTILKQLGVLEEPVAIYSMPFLDWQLMECAQILESGQKLIVDVDDYIHGMVGKADALQAGRFTPEVVDLHEGLLKKADLVTTSTQWIADQFRDRLGVTCVVCPNGLDMERFNIIPLDRATRRKNRLPNGTAMLQTGTILPRRRSDVTVVGWSGAAGHVEAFDELIVPAMTKVLSERDDVLFCVVGNPDPELSIVGERFPEHLRDRVYGEPFAPIYKHAAMLAQFHVALAPAMDNDFYRAKSPIRYLEAAASRSAVIASPTTYGDTVTAGAAYGTVGYVVDNDPDAWATQVMRLVADQDECVQTADNARRYVSERCTITQTKEQWAAAINSVLD